MLKLIVLAFLRMAFEKVLVYSHQKNLKALKINLVTGPCITNEALIFLGFFFPIA